ncbi:MAG: hypothetical protein RLQ73_21995 [Hoeflea sp. D1-CHI-28]
MAFRSLYCEQCLMLLRRKACLKRRRLAKVKKDAQLSPKGRKGPDDLITYLIIQSVHHFNGVFFIYIA